MLNILVTGANRGIGLEFVKQYLDEGHQLWATYRQSKGGLSDIDSAKLSLINWDVNHELAPVQADKLPKAIDILINNAGIYGPPSEAQSLQNIDAEELSRVFASNAIAPLTVVQTLLPQLIAGKGIIANMSSKMGSSADNSSGGVYAYRASKAALCCITKSLANDLQAHQIRAISLHPGWVKTDMTGHSGLVDAATSVAGLRQVIADIDQYPSGAFVAYDGQSVPY